MAFTLQDELIAIRSALELDGVPVIIRATMTPGDELPASGTHIVIDLVPSAPGNDFGGSVYEDIDVQLQVWSDVSLVSALASAEAARGRMATLNYAKSSGTRFDRDEDFVGVVMSFMSVAMFDALA